MLWVGQMIERLVVLILLVAEVVTLLAPTTLPPASIRCRARSKAAVAIQSSKTMADRDETVVLPNGFKLAVRIWGDPDACPQCPQHRWLALHGWADNAASYDRLAPMMLLEGATAVVAVDFAGHGRSDHRWPTYHDEDDVADVVADSVKMLPRASERPLRPHFPSRLSFCIYSSQAWTGARTHATSHQ